jgi:hypothetical protein
MTQAGQVDVRECVLALSHPLHNHLCGRAVQYLQRNMTIAFMTLMQTLMANLGEWAREVLPALNGNGSGDALRH